MRSFQLNQKVQLSSYMRRVCTNPEKYTEGVVTRVGDWNTYHVLWKRWPFPIMMKGDELEEASFEKNS